MCRKAILGVRVRCCGLQERGGVGRGGGMCVCGGGGGEGEAEQIQKQTGRQTDKLYDYSR